MESDATKSVVLIRRLKAPVEDVFAAWTDPATLSKWLAPGKSHVTEVVNDVRVGGDYSVRFEDEQGAEHQFCGQYLVLDQRRRVTMTWRYDGPLAFLRDTQSVVDVELEPLAAEATQLTLTHCQLASAQEQQAYQGNWPTCLAKLAEILGSESRFYSAEHRALQEKFDSGRMAEMMENAFAHAAFDDREKEFIERADMFFLATIDPRGRPTVSYKGGDTGFVKVTGPRTLAFPSYDGNGMHYSSGNIAENGKIGILFIDFETPNRLRVHGTASLNHSPEMLAQFPGAQYVVTVAVDEIWLNCARYIHRYQRQAQSRYTPKPGEAPKVPAWKRIDTLQSALPEEDQDQAQREGLITIDGFFDLLDKGDS